MVVIPRIPKPASAVEAARVLRNVGVVLTIATGPAVRAQVSVGHTGDSLCLHYSVVEPTVRAVAAAPNSPVYEDSCVECFISFDDSLGYYNIETNCIGTRLVGFGIDRNRRRRLDPSILARIDAVATLGSNPFPERLSDGPWELTVVVPTAVFAYHPDKSLDGVSARANFYKCGDELSSPHWESWAPVRTAEPDFHRPEYFAPVRFA